MEGGGDGNGMDVVGVKGIGVGNDNGGGIVIDGIEAEFLLFDSIVDITSRKKSSDNSLYVAQSFLSLP